MTWGTEWFLTFPCLSEFLTFKGLSRHFCKRMPYATIKALSHEGIWEYKGLLSNLHSTVLYWWYRLMTIYSCFGYLWANPCKANANRNGRLNMNTIEPNCILVLTFLVSVPCFSFCRSLALFLSLSLHSHLICLSPVMGCNKAVFTVCPLGSWIAGYWQVKRKHFRSEILTS